MLYMSWNKDTSIGGISNSNRLIYKWFLSTQFLVEIPDFLKCLDLELPNTLILVGILKSSAPFAWLYLNLSEFGNIKFPDFGCNSKVFPRGECWFQKE